MKKNLLILALLIMFANIFSAQTFADTPDMGGFLGVYYTPTNQTYDVRPAVPRPPLWTAQRWDGISDSTGYVFFENWLANGTDTEFQLALNPSEGIFKPIVYVDESALHIYQFCVGQSEIDPSHYTINQGTGLLTLDFAPNGLCWVFFEIVSPESRNVTRDISQLKKRFNK